MFAEDPNIIEVKSMDIDPATGYPTVMYSVSKIFMMTKRETLIKLAVSKIESGEHAGKDLIIIQSIERDDFPINKEAIRIDMF